MKLPLKLSHSFLSILLAAALITIPACSGHNAAETRLREVISAPLSLTLLHVDDTNSLVIPHDVMFKFNDNITLTKVGGWSLLMAANIDISRGPALTGLFKPYTVVECGGRSSCSLTWATIQ